MVNINKNNNSKVRSLRKRAIALSVLISSLIVLVTFFGYFNVKKFDDESSLHLMQRDDLLISLSLIRGEILESYKGLNNFLLVPESEFHQEKIFISIKEAIRISNELHTHPWIKKYKREDVSNRLEKGLNILKQDVSELIKVRFDLTNQYPSLAVGSEVMQPNRDRLNNALSLAMNEAVEDDAQIENPEVYRSIIQTRHLWTQVLSTFRLYLANRVGSFNTKALATQERSIEVAYEELRAELARLQGYADSGELGFETTEVMGVMFESSALWFKGFSRVKVIHHSDEWRRDAQIMKEVISPRIDSIVDSLIVLQDIITESYKEDKKLYESLGDSQNRALWLIAFLGIFLAITIVLSLDKLIFKPIALVSNALKLEALGRKSDHIPVVKAKETQDLVDAFSEMSRQVHNRQIELEFRALHDALTSLPNRTLLIDRIEHDIRTARRESHSLSLLILDLDNFKEVNDTLGHLAGDELLIEVGARINAVLRDVDTVARIGGDEFSILLPHTDEKQAVVAAKKVLSSFSKSIRIEEVDVSVSASIGIALYPLHGEDVHALLRHADVAMYVAKRNRAGFKVYSDADDEHSISRLSMTKDFRDALENNALTLNYQPVFDMADNSIVAVEALLRWHHPKHGTVPPDKFIYLAEQMGLINQLTYMVLDESIAQVSKWHLNNNDLAVAVNLSVYSFKDPKFIAEVGRVLKKYQFPSHKLKLEITEGAMMDNPLQAVEVLTELHSMGIKLSIDDYGTGFSSMSYLKQLPVDELKIDKSFVIGLDKDKSNDAIVRSTIDLAHNLGLQVVAEGIETAEINEMLRSYRCDMAQGFHLSRPMPAEKIEALIKS